MSGIKSIYGFNEEEQYLRIDFLSEDQDASHSWQAYVFDENWTDLIGSAASISNRFADVMESAYEKLGLRGRIAVISELDAEGRNVSAVDTSLFHLQALLNASAILVIEEWSSFEEFGFKSDKLSNGETFYYLASEETAQDSCRFL